MRCEDPTNGELSRVRTIDLCLSRLVEPNVVNDLLARFPSDLVSFSESPSALPHLYHINITIFTTRDLGEEVNERSHARLLQTVLQRCLL